MKKTNLVLGALAMLFASALVFTGCNTEPVIETYTVTFDSDGGSDVAAVTVNANETVAEPEAPTKTGYTFGGWYDGETAYDFTTAVTADITLKASWTLTNYTINYDLAGGTNSEKNPATYTMETTDIVLEDPTGPADAPNFVAWHSTAKPAEGEWGDVVKGIAIAKGSTGDKTFYAEFTSKATYTVSFYNGDTVVDTKAVVDGNTVAASDKALVGYTFDAWYADKDFTTKFDFTAAITADTAIYGKYTIITYTVTFDADNGTTATTTTVKYGEKVSKPETDPTKDGKEFSGWYNGSTAYDFSSTVSSDLTLKAKWTDPAAVKYTVTFDSDGGSEVVAQSVVENTVATKPTDPTKDDLNFVGWYEVVSETMSETEFDFATLIIKDTTLKAKWAADPVYQLTVNFAGLQSDLTLTATSDNEYSIAEPTLSYPRKVTVSGYYSDAEFTSPVTFPMTLDADKTIYAKGTSNYTVMVAEDEKTYTTTGDYGQIALWSSADGIDVAVGDWIIASGTIAFENIGQTYVQIGITPEEGSASYPMFGQYYTTDKGTNSYELYKIYTVETAGKLTYASMNNGSADGTNVTALKAGSEITITDLKLVHIPAANLSTVLPFYSKEATVSVANSSNEYQYAPAISCTAPKYSSFTVSFTRPALTNDYKSHYVNSTLGWNATYPSKSAQRVSISKVLEEETALNWVQIGIQAGADEGTTMTWTDLEISVIPNISAF